MNETSIIENLEEKVESKSLYPFVKRTIDIMVGLIGCILLLPVTIIIKIAYMLTGDFASIFYRQVRIGKNGKLIKIYKYRTMIVGADEVLKQLLKQKKYKEEWKKNQKLDNDPRITKVGKILRKLSIDEIPQFINVLTGDMSLIGPRPLVIGELDQHNGNHEIYESVRPGITGWWACNGRSELDYEKRLELEYYYVKNISFYLDVTCVFKTIKAVFKKTGAK